MGPEVGATACNLAANALLLRRTLLDPRGAVPVAAIALQFAGNLLWMAHAAFVARDPYLFATATASGAMQLVTCCALARETARARARAVRSETQLPCLPPGA